MRDHKYIGPIKQHDVATVILLQIRKTVTCEQWSAVPKTYRMTECQLVHVENWLEDLQKTGKQYWGN